MTSTTFRHHDAPPANVTSPLLRQLTDEWVALNAAPGVAATMRRWGRAEPRLRGLARPGDVVDAIDAGPHQGADGLMLALLRLFQDGHQLAGRTLLQAMLPKLVRLSFRHRETAGDDGTLEERRHVVVAEFWDALAHYPVARRHERVAANLAFETLRRVTAPGRPREEPVEDVEAHLAPDDEVGPSTDTIDVDADLQQVVEWALARAVLNREDAGLILDVYSASSGRWGSYGFEEAGQRLGLSAAAARKRCSRAVQKLTAAVQAQVLADNAGEVAHVA